jgi:predicted lipoprotein with Yx(FWY)xxD motif
MGEEHPRREAAPATPGEVSVFIEHERFVFKAEDARAIYYFDKDRPGRSNCYGTCATVWQPVLAPREATAVGDWTTLIRRDASKQWAYKGRPVYTFAQDEPGRTNGDGVQGLWHVLKP